MTTATGEEFERNPPHTFVVSSSAEATQETLTLNLIPFSDPPELANVGYDRVKSSTNFQAARLNFALLSFVQFDLDGNGAYDVMVAERKRTLDLEVSVSKRHFENYVTAHAQRCTRTTRWMALQLQHVLADLRPFPSACAGDG